MVDNDAPRTLFSPGEPITSKSAGLLGMLLFLAALMMLFGATLAGYLYIRFWGSDSPKMGSVHFPHLLYLSTVLVIGVSMLLHRALVAVRRQHVRAFRAWLTAALAGAIAFIVVQTPAMVMLIQEHEVARKSGVFLYGLIFFMVLLHALHVVGGVISLGWIQHKAGDGAYDHENFQPVRNAAFYWHFLDGVWIVMFVTFWALG